jgi:hypothetical protein
LGTMPVVALCGPTAGSAVVQGETINDSAVPVVTGDAGILQISIERHP